MSGEIKPGDLVMVVRGNSCCGHIGGWHFGETFVVTDYAMWGQALCRGCNLLRDNLANVSDGESWCAVEMVKKLDPPAEGDSLPTRADIEVPTCS